METKIRVRLETRQARSDLSALEKDGVRTAARVGRRLSSAVGSGLNRSLSAVGLGGGIGAGLAAVRGATESSFGDVLGEAFGSIGESLEQRLLGDLGEKARADRSAREETISAFGLIAGQTGRVPPGAKAYFDQIRSIRAQEEAGRNIFERDARFRSVGAQDLVDRVLSGIGELLTEAATLIADKLNPFS